MKMKEKRPGYNKKNLIHASLNIYIDVCYTHTHTYTRTRAHAWGGRGGGDGGTLPFFLLLLFPLGFLIHILYTPSHTHTLDFEMGQEQDLFSLGEAKHTHTHTIYAPYL